MNRLRTWSKDEPHLLLCVLAATLIGFGGAFVPYYFRQLTTIEQTAGPLRPRIQWTRDSGVATTTGIQPGNLLEMLDPSLIALPSSRGFSRDLWARTAPARHQSELWPSQPAFLEPTLPVEIPVLLPEPRLANAVQAAAVKTTPVADEATAELIEPPVTVRESALQMQGGLAGRALLRQPPLPRIVSETALRPTRMRVGVAADGLVAFVVLERTSGNEKADAQALDLIRQIRFEPAPVEPAAPKLAWGVVKVFWATDLPSPAATP